MDKRKNLYIKDPDVRRQGYARSNELGMTWSEYISILIGLDFLFRFVKGRPGQGEEQQNDKGNV